MSKIAGSFGFSRRVSSSAFSACTTRPSLALSRAIWAQAAALSGSSLTTVRKARWALGRSSVSMATRPTRKWPWGSSGFLSRISRHSLAAAWASPLLRASNPRRNSPPAASSAKIQPLFLVSDQGVLVAVQGNADHTVHEQAKELRLGGNIELGVGVFPVQFDGFQSDPELL